MIFIISDFIFCATIEKKSFLYYYIKGVVCIILYYGQIIVLSQTAKREDNLLC